MNERIYWLCVDGRQQKEFLPSKVYMLEAKEFEYQQEQLWLDRQQKEFLPSKAYTNQQLVGNHELLEAKESEYQQEQLWLLISKEVKVSKKQKVSFNVFVLQI